MRREFQKIDTTLTWQKNDMRKNHIGEIPWEKSHGIRDNLMRWSPSASTWSRGDRVATAACARRYIISGIFRKKRYDKKNMHVPPMGKNTCEKNAYLHPGYGLRIRSVNSPGDEASRVSKNRCTRMMRKNDIRKSHEKKGMEKIT